MLKQGIKQIIMREIFHLLDDIIISLTLIKADNTHCRERVSQIHIQF